MDVIVYGGVKYYKVRSAVYCRSCGDTIECKRTRDFKMCSCGSVGIDDARILGDAEDRCMYRAEVGGKRMWLPPKHLR
jgi:hypothetical protein